MSNYPYNPLLKTPDRPADINMEKPSIVRLMRAMNRAKQGDYFTLPQIVKNPVTLEKTSYVSSAGVEIPLFVIRPQEDRACRKDGTDQKDGTDLKVSGAGNAGLHGLRPAMLLLHGGAFALPMQQSAVELGAVYAAKCGITVFLPEYSMLPEVSGERALLDCIECYRLLQSEEYERQYGIDRNRIVLYGESAGGALAAGTALYVKDHPENFAAQPEKLLLIYPVLDDSEAYVSKTKYAMAAWTAGSNRSMWKAYLAGASGQWLPYLIPMRHSDLRELPKTYIEPQEIDILCDEAEAFAARLQTAGVETALHRIPGSYHSFDADVENPFVQSVLQERIRFLGESPQN